MDRKDEHRMNRLHKTLPLILIFLVSCSGGSATSKEEGNGENTVPSISQSPENPNHLTIAKGDLGTEFLLQASIVPQRSSNEADEEIAGFPTPTSLQAKIVVFSLSGDKLVMSEANEGNMPSDELPSNALITTFPVILQNDTEVIYDFDAGIRTLAQLAVWYNPSISSDPANNIVSSAVHEVKRDGDLVMIYHDLTLQEVVIKSKTGEIEPGDDGSEKIEFVAGQSQYIKPYEVVWGISKYNKNPDFVPVKYFNDNYLGYFSTDYLFQKDFGDAYANIVKWDISKPVTYYISSLTPEKYRDAVKDGILYWNKVFGREVMRAEMAPDDVTAPNYKYNMIQWYTGPNETYAYADAQVDPRTGEILQANIIFPSMWVDFNAPLVLKGFDDGAGEQPQGGELNLQGFRSGVLDRMETEDVFGGDYKYFELLGKMSAEIRVRVLSDIVRRVIVHEVGHTLGLTHNFAASVSDDRTSDESEVGFEKYITTGELPDDPRSITTSVMDYHTYRDRILIGAYINREDSIPFEYDDYAIKWGYSDSKDPPQYTGIPYCLGSDEDAKKFFDCQENDHGRHILERRASDLWASLRSVPRKLAESYLFYKAALNPTDRKSVSSATPKPKNIARGAVEDIVLVSDFFTSDKSLISIIRKYPDYFSDIDGPKVSDEVNKWLESEIDFAGGIEKTFKAIDPEQFREVAGKFNSDFNNIIGLDSFLKYPLPEGGTVSFTDDELNYMRARAKEIFEEVEYLLVFNFTSKLADGKFKKIGDIGLLESVIADWAEFVLLEGENGFKYYRPARLKAVDLLLAKGPYPDWLDAHVTDIAAKLAQKFERIFGVTPDAADPGTFPREKQQCVMDEKELYLKLISGAAKKRTPAPEPEGSAKSDGNDLVNTQQMLLQ